MTQHPNGRRYTREDWLPLVGLTHKEAAARLGARPETAARAERLFPGIWFWDGRKPRRKRAVPDRQWRKLAERGLSAVEAASIEGVSPITARKAARRLGFRWRDVRGEVAAKLHRDPDYRARAMRGLNRTAFAPKLTGAERDEYRYLVNAKHIPAIEAIRIIGRADLLEAA